MKRTYKKDIVRAHLERHGEITNHWAIDTRLTTRLAAVIKVLRNSGMEIETSRVPGTKDTRYSLPNWKPKPRIVSWDTSGGVARPVYAV